MTGKIVTSVDDSPALLVRKVAAAGPAQFRPDAGMSI